MPTLSRPAIPRRWSSRTGHLVLCGDDTLAFRMAEELTTRYGEDVTVILPSRERDFGPRIARLPNVRVLERPELSAETFEDAQIRTARALALLHRDDMVNIYAALRARQLNRGLRLVVNVFNTSLGHHLRRSLADCAVLAAASTAAPSFVAAALDEPAPSHVRVEGRTLYVTSRDDLGSGEFVCGLAERQDSGSPGILPEDQDKAELVLAVADGTPRDPLLRRRHPVRAFRSGVQALRAAARALLTRKLGIAYLAMVTVLAGGFAVLFAGARYRWADALYLTLLDAAGATVTSVHDSAPERLAQVMITFDGMALWATVTATLVGIRLPGARNRGLDTTTDHVIVVGLGKVGTRVALRLHDLGHRVVCVDRNEQAFGVEAMEHRRIPVVIGPSDEASTLQRARIEDCRALICVTSRDTVNLETAMNARRLRDKLRIVLRLFDDDLAAAVEADLIGGDVVSRSVSYLAAPEFAVAMLEHQVQQTIPVGRHVLLIAEVPIEAGSELAGRPLQEVHEAGQARVIALRHHEIGGADWAPHPGYLLAAGDCVIVLATRAGLGRVLARSTPSPEAAGTASVGGRGSTQGEDPERAPGQPPDPA